MMQLTITDHMNDILAPGMCIKQHTTLANIKKPWPGIASFDVWFRDPVFGKYRDLEELTLLEVLAAEEETNEFMDATAPSATAESEALALDTECEAGSDVSGDDMEAADDNEDGRATKERSPLTLLDLKVRS